MEASVWNESFRVRSFEVAPDGRLALPFLFGYLQEAASNHAQALGVAFIEVEGRPVFWVLHHIDVCLYRRPAWAETVTVATWPCGYQGLKAFRAFTLRDSAQHLLSEAYSIWLLVDPQRRRPVRLPEAVLHLRGMSPHPKALEIALPDPPSTPSLGETTFSVSYSDLDLNAHANNTRYVAWLLNALPTAYREQALHRIQLTFRSEAYLGDPVTIQSWPLDEGRLCHRFLRPTDGRLLAEGLTAWSHLDE